MNDKTTPPETPWPLAALDAAIEAARIADPTIWNGDKSYVLVPRGMKLEELENPFGLPPYIKQLVTVDDRASLSAYANRFRDHRSIIVADFDGLTIAAHLDWHDEAETKQRSVLVHFPDGEVEEIALLGLEPGPNTHTVTLRLRPSEEFTRWNAMAGKMHSQEDFARFLEENAVDVLDPAAAVMIELSRDFEATVGQSYKSSVRLDNGDRRMVFESETKALNDVIIPAKFTLNIPIYNGEQPEELTALFRWKAVGGGAVQFGFVWHRVEYQRRAKFQEIAYTAAEETGLPVYIGRAA